MNILVPLELEVSLETHSFKGIQQKKQKLDLFMNFYKVSPNSVQPKW